VHDEPTQEEGRTSGSTHPETAEPDDALILWMLSLTPTKRLEVAQGFIDGIEAIRLPDPTTADAKR
jgi:hypothetical protein